MFSRIINILISVIMAISSILGIGSADKKDEMISYNLLKTSVTVSISENPSTGYKWKYNVINETVAKVTHDEYIHTAPDGLVGAPGVRKLTFKGLKPGSTKIIMTYEREWEGEPVRTIEILLTVNSDLTLRADVFSDVSKY